MGFQAFGAFLLDKNHPAVITEMERVADTFDPNRSWVNRDGSPYRLSDRVWDAGQTQRREIDKILKAGMATGRDALKIAKDLETYLLPELRPMRTASGRLTKGQPKRIVTATPGRGGKGSYPARRVARTEVSRAHAEATRDAALMNPFAETMGYRLSGSHPRSDPCDQLAMRDLGFGPGNYPVRDCPIPPIHPHCLCHLEVNGPDNLLAVVDSLKLRYNLADPTSESFLFPDDRVMQATNAKVDAAAQHIVQRRAQAATRAAARTERAAARNVAAEEIELIDQAVIEGALRQTTERTLLAEENAIRQSSIEHAVAVDPKTGQVVFRKSGQKSQVAFTDAEADGFKDMILTHNHPSGWDYARGIQNRDGSSFSGADFFAAVESDMQSIRAVSPRYRFELNRPEGGWPPLDMVRKAHAQIDGEIQAQFYADIRAGRRTIQNANADHTFFVNRRMYDRFKWDYRVIEDPDPLF